LKISCEIWKTEDFHSVVIYSAISPGDGMVKLVEAGTWTAGSGLVLSFPLNDQLITNFNLRKIVLTSVNVRFFLF